MVDGSAKERELVREVRARDGWVAMRAPSSGSATADDLPDVLAGKDGLLFCIELKSSSGDPVYVEAHEVEALERFAQALGGQPLLACRWQSRSLRDSTFYLARPDALYRTDGGRYRAKYEDMATPTWRSLGAVLARDAPLA